MSKPYVARGRKTSHNLTTEDKLNAIQRIQNGETKASVSREIGVPESTLRGWCKRALRDKLQHLQQPNASIARGSVSALNNNANSYDTTNTWLSGLPNGSQSIDQSMLNDPEFISMVSKVQHYYEQLHSVSKYLEAQRIQQQFEEMQQQQMQQLMKQQEQLHLEQLRCERQRQDNWKRQEMLVQLLTPREQQTPNEQQRTMALLESQIRATPPLVEQTTGAFPLVELLAKLIDVTFGSTGHELQTNIGEIIVSYHAMMHARDKLVYLRKSEVSQEIGNLRHICNLLNEFLTTGNGDDVVQKIKKFIENDRLEKSKEKCDSSIPPKTREINNFDSVKMNIGKDVVNKVNDENINNETIENLNVVLMNEKSYNSDNDNFLYSDDSDNSDLNDWNDPVDSDEHKSTLSENNCQISTTI